MTTYTSALKSTDIYVTYDEKTKAITVVDIKTKKKTAINADVTRIIFADGTFDLHIGTNANDEIASNNLPRIILSGGGRDNIHAIAGDIIECGSDSDLVFIFANADDAVTPYRSTLKY